MNTKLPLAPEAVQGTMVQGLNEMINLVQENAPDFVIVTSAKCMEDGALHFSSSWVGRDGLLTFILDYLADVVAPEAFQAFMERRASYVEEPRSIQ